MKRSAAVQPPDCDMAIGCCDRRENAVTGDKIQTAIAF